MSLRLFAILSCVYVAAACGESSSASDSTTAVGRPAPIFRSVDFGDFSVALGEPLRNKTSLGQLIGDTAVRLAETKFGGAEAITVHLSPGDTVRGMTYDYGVEANFERRVTEYTDMLGPPTRQRSTGSREAPTDVVQWTDSATHFELRWIPQGAGAVAQSVLLDRRLAGL